MNKQRIIFQVFFTIILCLVIESISWAVLHKRNQHVGFLFNLNYKNLVNNVKGFGFDEIDPLCGWAMSNEKIKEAGYTIEQNCAVLRSKADYPIEPLKVFITGGSTSDIILHKDNWPNELHKLFVTNHINATIYAGGVGGYSSGQELLKLLRDGLAIKPDIHISYAGANDGEDGGYISDYEQAFYETAYRESFTSTVLPSTIFLTKQLLGLNYQDLRLKKVTPMDASYFWIQNMTVMSAIAEKNKYAFIGILQPVLGQGKYQQPNEKDIDQGNYKAQYEKYYPAIETYISKDTSLYNLTDAFDIIKGNVYVDDCHIKEEYQHIVARRVYELLIKKKSPIENE